MSNTNNTPDAAAQVREAESGARLMTDAIRDRAIEAAARWDFGHNDEHTDRPFDELTDSDRRSWLIAVTPLVDAVLQVLRLHEEQREVRTGSIPVVGHPEVSFPRTYQRRLVSEWE